MDFLIANCNRDFGNKKHVIQERLFVIGILFGSINGGSRLIWGYLMDKFGFWKLMFIISSMEVAIGCSLYFAVNWDILYIILVNVIAACLGGNFAMISPVFMKVFGLDLGPEVYGISSYLIGIGSVCGPILTKLILSDITDYLFAFIIGGLVCSVKIIVLFFFDENDKYVCKNKTTEQNKNDEIVYIDNPKDEIKENE